MTKTTEIINPNINHKNKRFTSHIYALNNLNNYNTSNASIISSKDFNNTRYGGKFSTSFISNTAQHKMTKLINFRPTSIETKINIDKMNFFKKPNVPRNLDVLN